MIKPAPLMLLPLLSFFWLACGVAVAGLFYPGYSHLSQFMSELGATGVTHGVWVNLLVFAGAEFWVLLFLALAARKLIGNGLALSGLLLLAVYACLLITAALFPCDFECRPVEPSRSHLVHIGAGMLAYVTGLSGLFLVSEGLRRDGRRIFPKGLEIVVLLTGAGFFSGTLLSQDHAGLYQRLLEGLLYLWMIRIGVVLTRNSHQRSSLRAA